MMKKKILAIQGSSLKKINTKTDTTFFLGVEAQRRNYDIYYFEPQDLSFKNGKVIAKCLHIKFIRNNSAAKINDNKTTIKELFCHKRKLKSNINAKIIKIEIMIEEKT